VVAVVAQGRAVKHVKQIAEHDCGVAVVAMLADAPYWRANAASAYDDYPHSIVPREMVKLLRGLTGRPWELLPGHGQPLGDFKLLARERAAVAIITGEGKDKRGHWVAWDDGTVYCPTHDAPVEPADLGPEWTVHRVVRETSKPTSGKEAAKMKITPNLKSFLQAEHGLAASASDKQAKALVLEKFANGELDAETVAAKSMDEAKSEKILDNIAARLMKRAEQKMTDQGGSTKMDRNDNTPDDKVTPHSLLLGGKKGNQTKDGFSTHKSVAVHAKTGQTLVNERGCQVMTASDYEKAKAGALLKQSARAAGIPVELDELDRHLLNEMYTQDEWCGKMAGAWYSSIEPSRAKALLEDGTSGGQEIVPVWFDSMLVETPLTGGELYPFVDLRDVPRGSSVEGGSIGNPTLTWDTAEGTALTLFNTASLVAEINTSIFPVAVAIEVGKDFMSDSPAAVGEYLVAAIGRKLRNEFDRVIAVGDGSTQPTGIFTASGVTQVDVANPTTGPMTVGDYEALMSGVDKAQRVQGEMAYLSSDAMYFRARGVSVGSDDARRVFGMDHASYRILDTRYAVHNGIADGRVAYGNLKRYRMYRRAGVSLEWHTSGQTLALKNTALLIARARIGGRPVDANAFSKILNGAVQ
jgi:HK97 family phage major capsid protein